VLKYHRFSLGSFHVIKQEFTSSRILAPWSALQGAELIKITILFKNYTYPKNIHKILLLPPFISICVLFKERFLGRSLNKDFVLINVQFHFLPQISNQYQHLQLVAFHLNDQMPSFSSFQAVHQNLLYLQFFVLNSCRTFEKTALYLL